MKRFLLLSLCVLLSLGTFAQISHTSSGSVDKNAQQMLQKAAKKMNSNAVSFNVTMINKNSNKKETNRMKATVLFNKGKYRVTSDNQILYCDGTAVWHWNKDVNECTVNKLDGSASDDLMNPAALLSNYSKNFRAKFIRQENDGTVVIDLSPKKARSYHKVRLLINGETGVLKKLELHNYDGSCGEYVVSNFKSGVACKDSDFIFPQSQNPKVEVIDMR